MLTESHLRDLLLKLEADNIERTESINKTDKFCEAICAFANNLPNHKQPGYLLIGVKDDGTLAGLTVNDELLKNLGGIRSDGNVLPQPPMTVSKFSFADGDIAVVEVTASDLPPVRYKGRYGSGSAHAKLLPPNKKNAYSANAESPWLARSTLAPVRNQQSVIWL